MQDGTIIRVPQKVLKNLTDLEIRNWVKSNLPNGEYCTKICKRCGLYMTSLNGRVAQATLYEDCNAHTPVPADDEEV